jgi:hypothetical protein
VYGQRFGRGVLEEARPLHEAATNETGGFPIYNPTFVRWQEVCRPPRIRLRVAEKLQVNAGADVKAHQTACILKAGFFPIRKPDKAGQIRNFLQNGSAFPMRGRDVFPRCHDGMGGSTASLGGM